MSRKRPRPGTDAAPNVQVLHFRVERPEAAPPAPRSETDACGAWRPLARAEDDALALSVRIAVPFRILSMAVRGSRRTVEIDDGAGVRSLPASALQAALAHERAPPMSTLRAPHDTAALVVESRQTGCLGPRWVCTVPATRQRVVISSEDVLRTSAALLAPT